MTTTATVTPASAGERLEEELAALAAHINAATARWLEMVSALGRDGNIMDDVARWLAFRCGIAPREAREYARVAEALHELPAIRAAFSHGELTFTKVRALTRLATPGSEQALLDLARVLTASQLERALRAFRRVQSAEAGESHALEYIDYHWETTGRSFFARDCRPRTARLSFALSRRRVSECASAGAGCRPRSAAPARARRRRVSSSHRAARRWRPSSRLRRHR